jgi:hypothetical protein
VAIATCTSSATNVGADKDDESVAPGDGRQERRSRLVADF